MSDIASQRCDYPGCVKHPNFGKPGDKCPNKCKTHATAAMVDLRGRLCDFPGCTKHPNFGHPGNKRPTKCKRHADALMINTTCKHCNFPGCTTVPSFGLITDKRPTKCKLHADASMLDIVSRHCDFQGCTTQSHFGLISDKHPTRCQVHADAKMIDISSAYCISPECATMATFNFRGIRPQYCAKHRKLGMVYKPTKRCDDCHRNLAEYGDPKSEVPIHCELHKLPIEVNFAQRICKLCKISFVLDEQGLCQFCGSGVQSTHLVKQKEIEDYLKANLSETIKQKWKSTDSMIDHGTCGKERPDFLFDADSHFVIIECDEHQHNAYPCECEQARMINIANGLGMPTIFIRYNPDNYKYAAACSASKRMTSKVRRDLLISALTDEMKRDITDIQPIEVIYVCYDGCDVSCVSKHTILSTEKEEEIEPQIIQTVIDPQNEAPQA
ncbi:MAG: hypothetical protein M0R33_15605 [Methylomonas sp.]|uniref:hypothetical protein n=1 Tax=Methylomonas sp. TaxID=418 RepID=UPI0025EB49D7|nr:hypothetical protein [Methylomonas sp.]MCK9607869.1 hypothetical protein [Methylomonas sp.]